MTQHLKAGSVEGLETLIARLEAAEVGDLELDIGIGQALGLIGEGDDPRRLVYTSENGSLTSFGNCFPWPMWTSSLDSALALAERVLPDTEGILHNICVWPTVRKGFLSGPSVRIFRQVRDADAEGGWALSPGSTSAAKTAPLALCIAILKARLSLTLEGEG